MFANVLGLALISSCLSIAAIKLVLTYCRNRPIGLDFPDRRKVHRTPVPRLGGLGILAGFAAAVYFAGPSREAVSLFAGAVIIFAVGLIDDLKNINWKYKMAGTVIATSITVFYGGIVLDNLGDLFGAGPVRLGVLSVPFTFFCVIGVVNALNMIDGLNGLAGGLSVIMLGAIAFFAYLSGSAAFVYVAVALIGSLAGFLVFNYPKGSIFMGDSGSNLLGFALAISAIALFRTKLPSEPMIPVVILSLPIFDTVRVMVGRMRKGKSPFYPDKTHIHHILTRVGVRSRKAVFVLCLLTLAFSVSAVVLREAKGWQLLILFVNNMVLLGIFINFLVAKKVRGRRAAVTAEDAVPQYGLLPPMESDFGGLDVREPITFLREQSEESTRI
ncbi:MAG: undecaprenyl/decaprenyl-phosphate alpha-N-acetylglucosaminyl 1-phosphate transferase [Deltaproteobacteria bacterium]|nr:undecaprenyl/decaprenyl-phosphate alpha-N-acetylglucosaminyl 1-phosphate transferase [Deltaproteobacteria bacterium]